MTLRYGQVRRWRSGHLELSYAHLDRVRRDLLEMADELAASTTPADWTGTAGTAARERLGVLTDRIEHIVAEVAAARRAVAEVADDVAVIDGLVTEAEELARVNGFKIDYDGRISEIQIDLGDFIHHFDRRRRRDEIGVLLERVMRRANEIDDFLLSVFRKIVDNTISDGESVNLSTADMAGEQQGSLHHYLLDRYQVSVDPDGMVNYPDGVEGAALELLGRERMVITKGEADLLDDLGLAGTKDVYDIQKTARHEAEGIYPRYPITNSLPDAFRHAYLNAMLTNRFGEEWTARFTTAHERAVDNTPIGQAMDLHNNEVGRRIAGEHPEAGPEELKTLVDQAVRNGEMVVINAEGRLVRSDEFDFGGTSPAQSAEESFTSGGYNPGTDGDNYGTYDN